MKNKKVAIFSLIVAIAVSAVIFLLIGRDKENVKEFISPHYLMVQYLVSQIFLI